MSDGHDGTASSDIERQGLTERVGHRFGDGRSRLLRTLFGDRRGFALWLGALLVYVLYWRMGILVTDTYTVANTLVAVSEGHLHLEAAVYGDGLGMPGAHVVDGAAYGRNYGQVVTALPFLWLLQAISFVVDVRVAIAVAWSLCLFVLAIQLGTLRGQRTNAALYGGIVAIALLVVNLLSTTPIDPVLLPLLALQIQTMIAAAFVGVVCYRLVLAVHGQHVGTFAGLVTLFATPVGFWAIYPKRHALSAVLVVGVVYAFYRSRSVAEDRRRAVTFRALAYALVGFLAWIHSGEALLLLVVLAVVDVPTAPRDDRRTLVIVGIVFLLSLAPFFATNFAIAGDPVQPPRMLESFGGDVQLNDDPVDSPSGDGSAPTDDGARSASDEGATANSGDGSTPTATDGEDAPPGRVSLSPHGFTEPLLRLQDELRRGLVVLTEPERVYETFVTRNHATESGGDIGLSNDLSLLEATPILGVLACLPVLLGFRLRRASAGVSIGEIRSWPRRLGRDERRATDLLVVVTVVGFVLFYQPRLPVHAQVTVRYLLPVVPLAIYGVARLETVRRTLTRERTVLYGIWAIGVVLGVPLLGYVVASQGLSLGDAFRVHARLSLTVASVLGLWALVSPAFRADRAGAVVLALSAAAGTLFLLFAGLVYFDYVGPFALPFL